jgi:RNA polymerase sigma-70 factor, ECF subfamily
LPDDEREARFTALFDAHREAVRAYMRRRDPELADDVTAETFLVCWRRLDAVPPSRSHGSWEWPAKSA